MKSDHASYMRPLKNNYLRMKQKISVSLLVALLGFNGGLFAIDSSKKSTPNDSITITKQLQPVIIRSQRRTEELRSVPAAVSVILPSVIEHAGIATVKDITSRTPNFYMPQYGNKVNSPIYIRGIGSKFNTSGIAFYVDNVPFFEKSTFDFDLHDIGSIEVFRGPQGTLFGRNSMGGAISIYSKEISSMMKNDVVLSYGSKSYMRFKGSHANTYGKFGVSTSASYTKRDGFFKNDHTGKSVDDVNTFSAKVALKYTASPTLCYKLMGGVTLNNDGGNPYKVFNATTQQYNNVNFDEESYYTRSLAYSAFVVSKKFGDYELRNVSSYQYFQDHQHLDQDYTAEKVFTSNFYQYQHLVSNETVFLTPKVGKWSSQTGLFFFNQIMDKGIGILNGADAAKYQNGPRTQNIPGASNLARTNDKVLGFAFFHQSQFSDILIKGLNLVLGARFDYETKNFEYTNTTTLPSGVLPPTMPNPIVVFRDSSTQKFVFLPKSTLSYNFANQNVYVSWGLGYKSGGFNTSFEKSNPSTMIYNPEFAENYEVGVKTQWLDSRLGANAAIFYTDWKDQQVNVMLSNGQGLMIMNAGKSYSKGFEVEVNAIPATNLQVYASYGYVKAKYIRYEYFDRNISGVVSFNNSYLPFVPKSTFSGGASYRIAIGAAKSSSLIFGADYERVGSHYWNDGNSLKQDAWFNLNTMVGYTCKNLDLSLRIKNITNEKYNAYEYTYSVEKFSHRYAQEARPRFVYVELAYRF